MPRAARQLSSTGIYHIVIKGANNQRIFEDSKDFQKYLSFLEYYKNELDFEIYAYCLMSNHVHLLIQVKTIPLDVIFHRINTSYACWFNMKYGRTGYLQQGRYYSEPVESDKYLCAVTRYIHQNPTKAELEGFPGENYPWSSIYSYFRQDDTFVSTSFVINSFGKYNDFLIYNNTICEDSFLDLNTMKNRIPDDVAAEIIYKICNTNHPSDFQNMSISERDILLHQISKKGIPARQINRITGIPLGIIYNILSKQRDRSSDAGTGLATKYTSPM